VIIHTDRGRWIDEIDGCKRCPSEAGTPDKRPFWGLVVGIHERSVVTILKIVI
jgi:hypothetical protein